MLQLYDWTITVFYADQPIEGNEEALQALGSSMETARSQVTKRLRPALQELELSYKVQKQRILSLDKEIQQTMIDIQNLRDIKNSLPPGCYNTAPIERPWNQKGQNRLRKADNYLHLLVPCVRSTWCMQKKKDLTLDIPVTGWRVLNRTMKHVCLKNCAIFCLCTFCIYLLINISLNITTLFSGDIHAWHSHFLAKQNLYW